MHVDGRIDGDVQSESNVVIGADGYLKGRIKAATVVVSGRVDGSVSADRLEIIAGGCVEGDVHIVDLVIEPGGRFNGSSEIMASDAPAKHPGTGGTDSEPVTPPGNAETKKRPKSAESSSDEVGSASTA